MRIGKIANQLTQIAFNNLSIKDINRLRIIKWSILKHFINDKKQIKKFYHTELEIKIIEKLLPQFTTQDAPILLDIGANIGCYSYYLSHFIFSCGGTCIGFEPRTDTWIRLKENINNPNFIAERIALSNREGFADLFLPTSHGRSSLLKIPEFEGFQSEKVSITTLDSYINAKKLSDIVFIKIDVEGHENEVLEGASVTIQKYNPIILCESENRYLFPQGKSVEGLILYMLDLNYRAFVISKKSFKIMPAEEVLIPKDKKNLQLEYLYNFWFIPECNLYNLLPRIEQILEKIQTECVN